MATHLDFGRHMKPLAHEAAIRATFLGQAHIAGTGPEGRTCRECVFWGVEKVKDGKPSIVSPGHYAKSNKQAANQLKKGGCHKMKHRKASRRFTCHAAACRLFEMNETPPPAVRSQP